MTAEMFRTLDVGLVVFAFICVIGQVKAASGCTTTWSTSYNSTHPSPSNGWNDTEPMPAQDEINQICPNGTGILQVQCMDGNGEGFNGTKSDGISKATCDLTNGMHCVPQPGGNNTCPDLSLQIGCCVYDSATFSTGTPQASTITLKATPQPGTVAATQSPSAGHVTTQSLNSGAHNAQTDQDGDNGVSSNVCNIGLLLTTCVMLFVIT